jgi:hypothetical protein
LATGADGPASAGVVTAVELVVTAFRPDVVSRRSRFRSASRSLAVWYRTSRSFSRAFEMIRSSSGGTAGFASEAGAGSRFRIPSKTTPVVVPEKAWRPVAIS